jgi:YbgC/YbaW family acyl-CoA thioester hydrolase
VTEAPLSEHRLRRRVHFHEVDMAGFVHFSCFFRYMEEAEHALWRAAGLTIATPGEEFGFPRLAVACQFHAPLHFEDEFEVRVRVAAMSRRTLSYAFLLTRGETRIASGSATIACVDRRRGEPLKAIDIPPGIAQRFAVAPALEGADSA